MNQQTHDENITRRDGSALELEVRPPFKPTVTHMAVSWMLQRRMIPPHGGWWGFNPFSQWWL